MSSGALPVVDRRGQQVYGKLGLMAVVLKRGQHLSDNGRGVDLKKASYFNIELQTRNSVYRLNSDGGYEVTMYKTHTVKNGVRELINEEKCGNFAPISSIHVGDNPQLRAISTSGKSYILSTVARIANLG